MKKVLAFTMAFVLLIALMPCNALALAVGLQKTAMEESPPTGGIATVSVYVTIQSSYSIHFDAGSLGTIDGQQTKDYTENELTEMPVPTPNDEGSYRFGGWIESGKEEAGVVTDVSGLKDEEEHTLTAKWLAIITFKPNGGLINGSGDDVQKDVGELKENGLPQAVKDDYAFLGWFTDPVGGEILTLEYLVEQNTSRTVYAHYSQMSHTTFHLDANGGVFDDKTNKKDIVDPSSTEELPTPHRDGYKFDGWLENGKPVDSSVVGDGKEHTLKAHWKSTQDFSDPPDYPDDDLPTPPVFDVEFDSNGGSDVPKQSVQEGSKPRKPDDPTRDGYTFEGWFTDDGQPFDFNNDTVRDDMVLYAKWERDWNLTSDHIAYIAGYPDGKVHPNDSITRAEVAEIFFRLLKDDVRNDNRTLTHEFVDVPKGAWYEEAVATLSRMGIVYGKGDHKFDPNAPITRAEFAAMIVRFDKTLTGLTVEFKDVPRDFWAYDYIGTAAYHGWIYGYDDGLFRPLDDISRAETITLLNRALERDDLTMESVGELPEMKVWPDNLDKNAWYYLAVQEASNAHDYLKKNGLEWWIEILR